MELGWGIHRCRGPYPDHVRGSGQIDSKCASCGVDNFDILKQLTKTVIEKEFPTDTRLFLDLLLGFFNIVFTHGQCPPGVLSFYDAGEAIRLWQGAIKVRPIGKVTTYRKIVDVAQQLPHRQDLQTAFGDIQYCGASFGTERMQNSMNIHLSNHPDLTYSASDSSDAYCHAKRSKILSGVSRVMPEILSFTQRRLEAVQEVIYYGSEAGPVSIKQADSRWEGRRKPGMSKAGCWGISAESSPLSSSAPWISATQCSALTSFFRLRLLPGRTPLCWNSSTVRGTGSTTGISVSANRTMQRLPAFFDMTTSSSAEASM